MLDDTRRVDLNSDYINKKSQDDVCHSHLCTFALVLKSEHFWPGPYCTMHARSSGEMDST